MYVAYDKHAGAVLAVPCISKGDVRDMFHVSIELRCDNEPSIHSIQKAVINA